MDNDTVLEKTCGGHVSFNINFEEYDRLTYRTLYRTAIPPIAVPYSPLLAQVRLPVHLDQLVIQPGIYLADSLVKGPQSEVSGAYNRLRIEEHSKKQALNWYIMQV